MRSDYDSIPSSAETPLLKKEGSSPKRSFPLVLIGSLLFAAVIGTFAVQHFAEYHHSLDGASPSEGLARATSPLLELEDEEPVMLQPDEPVMLHPNEPVMLEPDDELDDDEIEGQMGMSRNLITRAISEPEEMDEDTHWSPHEDLDPAFVEEFYRVTGHRLNAVVDPALGSTDRSEAEHVASLKYLKFLEKQQQRDAEIIAFRKRDRDDGDIASVRDDGDVASVHGDLADVSPELDDIASVHGDVADVSPQLGGASANAFSIHNTVMKSIKIHTDGDGEDHEFTVGTLESFFAAVDKITEVWNAHSLEGIADAAVNRAVNTAAVMDACVDDVDNCQAEIDKLEAEKQDMRVKWEESHVELNNAERKQGSRVKKVKKKADKDVKKYRNKIDDITADWKANHLRLRDSSRQTSSTRRRCSHLKTTSKGQELQSLMQRREPHNFKLIWKKTDFDFEVTVTVDATVDPPKITKTKTDPVKMHTPEEKIKLMEDFVNGSDDVLDDCNAPNAKSNWQKMKIHGARDSWSKFKTNVESPKFWKGVVDIDMDNPTKGAGDVLGSGGAIVNAVDPWSGPEFCWLDSKVRGVGKLILIIVWAIILTSYFVYRHDSKQVPIRQRKAWCVVLR